MSKHKDYRFWNHNINPITGWEENRNKEKQHLVSTRPLDTELFLTEWKDFLKQRKDESYI